MTLLNRVLIACAGAILTLPCALGQRVSADGAGQTFSYLTDQYFQQVYFKFSPTAGKSWRPSIPVRSMLSLRRTTKSC